MIRRTDDRRRRVLLSTGVPSVDSTPSSTARANWRQARRPAVAYGSRVRRSLRGRWFSLVPVSTAAMVKFVAALLIITFMITLLHHWTMTVAGIQSRTELLAVFRIEAPGSIGRYITSVLWLLTAGVATLIYQLRCYRNDDFGGQYRLWRVITASCLIASAATATPLIAGLGSGLEWMIGQRVALSGSDWIRLLITLAAFVLAVRTIAELWGQHASAACNLLGWCLIALPVSVHWNLWQIDRPWRETAVTAAPLLAITLWLIGATQYLRVLFAEVRGTESEPSWLSQMMQSVRGWSFRAAKAEEEQPNAPEKLRVVAASKSTSASKPIQAVKPTPAERPTLAAKPVTKPTLAVVAEEPKPTVAARVTKTSATEEPESAEPAPVKAGWSWWPTRKKVTPSSDVESVEPVNKKEGTTVKRATEATVESAVKSAEKTPVKSPEKTSEKASEKANTEVDTEPPKRRFRFALPSFGGKSKTDKSNEASDEQPSVGVKPTSAQAPKANAVPPRDDANDSATDDDDFDDDNDDSGMSKSERRRQRKLMRRGKAA